MVTTILDAAPNLGQLYAKAAVTAFGRGGALPGEIRVPVRGTAETFIAYCPTQVERNETVLVIHSRGERAVDVEPAPWAAL